MVLSRPWKEIFLLVLKQKNSGNLFSQSCREALAYVCAQIKNTNSHKFFQKWIKLGFIKCFYIQVGHIACGLHFGPCQKFSNSR